MAYDRRRPAVRMGFALPVSGSWATPAALVRVARRAEELGYESLWTFSRLLAPIDAGLAPVYQSVHDPLITLAHVAAVTERARLGIAVLNAPFFSPIVLAKQLVTLDTVSAGRLDVGLGLGWSQEEFDAVGVSRERRAARTEEALACLRSIWTEDPVEFSGEFFSVPRSRVEPKPVQRPGPPILLGGVAEPALRRAGRLAEGWISISTADLTALDVSIAIIAEAARAAGRDPSGFRYVVRGVVRVRPAGDPDRRPLTGSIEEIRSDLAGIAAQGATDLFVDLNFDPEIGSPDADAGASMRRAEEALEAFAP